MASRFIWYELMTTDLEAGLDFYRSVVGWTASPHPGNAVGGKPYMILEARGRGVGGAMQLTDAMCDGGARPGWVGYIGVGDVDGEARAIEAAGGRIIMAPDDIPGVGRFAMVADPAGAPFYLLDPQPPAGGEPEPAKMTDPGQVGWHELYTAQGQEAAFAFYSERFGWRTVEEMDMGPMGKYRIFSAGGEPVGGMMDKPQHTPVSHWTFYFTVAGGIEEAVERVTSGGGRIVNGPMEVPGGQWIVQGFDPQGAGFALVAATR